MAKIYRYSESPRAGVVTVTVKAFGDDLKTECERIEAIGRAVSVQHNCDYQIKSTLMRSSFRPDMNTNLPYPCEGRQYMAFTFGSDKAGKEFRTQIK